MSHLLPSERRRREQVAAAWIAKFPEWRDMLTVEWQSRWLREFVQLVRNVRDYVEAR